MIRKERFWFTFEATDENEVPMEIRLGCGITAFSKEQAMKLLSKAFFQGSDLMPVASCIGNVDVSKLDENHILPNIGSPSLPGIWYPLGYDNV